MAAVLPCRGECYVGFVGSPQARQGLGLAAASGAEGSVVGTPQHQPIAEGAPASGGLAAGSHGGVPGPTRTGAQAGGGQAPVRAPNRKSVDAQMTALLNLLNKGECLFRDASPPSHVASQCAILAVESKLLKIPS